MSKQGTVKFFNPVKGFGFITPDGVEGADLFVHINDCVGDGAPADGDVVQFDSQYDESKGKERAVNVSGGTGSRDAGKGKGGKGKGKGKGKSYGGGYDGGYGGNSYGGGGYGGGESSYGGGGYGGGGGGW